MAEPPNHVAPFWRVMRGWLLILKWTWRKRRWLSPYEREVARSDPFAWWSGGLFWQRALSRQEIELIERRRA